MRTIKYILKNAKEINIKSLIIKYKNNKVLTKILKDFKIIKKKFISETRIQH